MGDYQTLARSGNHIKLYGFKHFFAGYDALKIP